jgi:hypothetical protein
MKIAIVGNRVGWRNTFVIAKLQKLGVTNKDVLLSGGAEGVDTFTQEFAKMIGAEIRIFYPNMNDPSPQRYYNRNEKIAMACDKMIAFDHNGNSQSGTKNSIAHAEKFGKPVTIIEEMDK